VIATCQTDIAPAIPGARHGGRSFARRAAASIGHAAVEVLENEEIAGRAGLLQRLDPRVKLLTLLLFAVTASLVHSAGVLVGLIGITLILAAASQVSVSSFARKVWSSAGLLVLLLALPATTQLITPGHVVVPLGPLSLTAPGLWAAATLVTRVVAASGLALLMIWTMRWTDLLAALTAMRMPDVIVATLAMAQKQIVTLLRTVEQTHLARESRTLSRGSSSENRSWVTGRMAFVVRKSVKTADDVYDAMLARGFDGSVRSITRLRMGSRDYIWTAAGIVVCAAVLLIDRIVMR
jgi:cobalt/nickel transport system permease protein